MKKLFPALVLILLAVCSWLAGQDLRPTLVFSQIADGGGIRFELNLVNSGHEDDTGTVFFRSGEGEPLEVLIGGTARSSLPYTVPAGGAASIESDGEGSTKTGYAVVQSDLAASKLAGTITYTVGAREVSVPSSPLSRQYHTYVERNSGANSGIAFANPGGQTVDIETALLETDGSVLDEKVVTLEPGHQLPRFINEIFDGVGSSFRGSVHARSPKNFAMVGLRQRASGSLAILSGSTRAFTGAEPPSNPPVAGPLSSRIVAVFPQIADGGGFVSEIFLTNSGTTEDSGDILIRDGNGEPLSLAIAGALRNSVPYTLPPGGALKIETDGAGDTKTGYVLVETDGGEAAISGSIVYSFSGFEVSVPNSPPTDESHVLVERTSSANSGIALANLGTDALSIDVFIQDEEGQPVDEATIELEGGQQRARFITEIFDGLPARILGSFHARSSDSFAILGLRQKSSGSLATLSGSFGSSVLAGTLVGPEGGQVVSPDGNLVLNVPAGAITETTRIEILETENAPDSLASALALSKTWKLKPDGLRFTAPAEVQWDYQKDSSEIRDAGQLGMLQWNNLATSSRVVPVPDSDSPATLEFQIDKLENLVATYNPSEMWSGYHVSWEQNATLHWYLEDGALAWVSVSNALDQWKSAGSNVRFDQVSDPGEAQLVFRDVGESTELGSPSNGQGDWKLADGEYGLTRFPFPVPTDGIRKTLTLQDQVVIEIAKATVDQADHPETLLTATLLHEIGHALGLAHPWREINGTAPAMAPGAETDSIQPWDARALLCHYGLSPQEVEVDFTARVTDVDDSAGLLGISTGQLLQGSVRYRSPAVDGDPDPSRGIFSSLAEVTLEIGPNMIEITPETVPGPFLEVGKRAYAGPSETPTDYFQVLLSTFDGATISYTEGPNQGVEAEDGELFLIFEDSDADVLDCDRPLVPSETGWDDIYFELFFFLPEYGYLEADILTLEVSTTPLGQ